MNITKYKLAGFTLILLASGSVQSVQSNASEPEHKFTSSRSEIAGYVYTRVNQILSEGGDASLHTQIEKYPVLFADFGTRCEFFLKNARQDISQGSRLSDRVYFKDVTRITSFGNVPAQSDQYGLYIYVGDKRYQVRKWSGMAALADYVRGGDCSKINQNDLTIVWPTLHFKVITSRNTVKWLETDLNSLVEFNYDKAKGISVYNEILKNADKEPLITSGPGKSFQQLKEEARLKAERSAEERKKKQMESSTDQQLKEHAETFRANVREGDDSHCGLVIEVKDKVVKVQTTVGEYWLKRDQLFPPQTKSCNFLNGVYREP